MIDISENLFVSDDGENDLKGISAPTCCFAVTDLIFMQPCLCPGSAVSLKMADQTQARQNTQALVPRNRYYDHHIRFIGW